MDSSTELTAVATRRGRWLTEAPIAGLCRTVWHGFGGWRRVHGQHVLNDVGTAVSGMALGVLLFTGLLRFTGHNMTTVLSGSMTPHLPIGALVVTERVTAAAVRAGDVVVFPDPAKPGVTVVHRLVSIVTNGAGQLQAHTKGDANRAADPWALVVAPSTPVDRAVAVVPEAGVWLERLRGIAAVTALAVAACLLVRAALRRVWSW